MAGRKGGQRALGVSEGYRTSERTSGDDGAHPGRRRAAPAKVALWPPLRETPGATSALRHGTSTDPPCLPTTDRSSFSNSDCVCPRSSASVRSSTKPRHDVHRRIAPRGRRSWSASLQFIIDTQGSKWPPGRQRFQHQPCQISDETPPRRYRTPQPTLRRDHRPGLVGILDRRGLFWWVVWLVVSRQPAGGGV